jgi:hypothetical protein
MLRNTFLLLVSILATPAKSETWSASGFDDGVWFIGAALSPDFDFIFQCGGRSAQNLPFDPSDITEPKLTAPNQIMLSVEPGLFGTPQPDQITDLAIVIDGTPFAMSPLQFNAFDGFFEAPLHINNPVFARLRAGSQAGLLWNGDLVARDIPLTGSSNAIRTMAQACVAGWASQPRVIPDWNAQTVIAEAARYCNGPAKVDMTYTHIRDLDGDGHADLILDMGAVECTGLDFPMSRGAGMCGASHCSNFVYLSRGPLDEPDEILAIGTRIVTNDQGQLRIHGGGGLGQCAAAGFDACEYQFDPTSGTLEYLGLVAFDPT